MQIPTAEPALERLSEDSALNAAGGRLADFFHLHGSDWHVTWDRRADRPHLIQGQGLPLIPGRGNDLRRVDLDLPAGQVLDLDGVALRAWDALVPWHDLLGVEGMDLRLDPARSGGSLRRGDQVPSFWNLEWQQFVGGVPVIGARLFVRVSQGNAVQWGTIRVADVGIDTEPRITVENAERRAFKALSRAVPRRQRSALQSRAESPQGRWREARRGTLEIVVSDPSGLSSGADYEGLPGLGYGHRLVWRFEKLDAHDHRYLARIDAHSGEVVELSDLTDFSGVAPEVSENTPLESSEKAADATVRGDVYLRSQEDPLDSVPFPFTAVDHPGQPITDADGVYDYQGGAATVRLDGAFVEIDDRCGAIALTDAVDGNLDLGGSGATDCATPGFGGSGNTDAARTTFYHLVQIRNAALPFFPFLSWLHDPLPSITNIDDDCNAFWNGVSVNFFTSSPGFGCGNTGENPDVIYHEWGHGFDNNSGGLGTDKGSGESFGDTFAMLMARDACIGDGFHDEPCGTCGPTCTGIRDAGVVAVGGSRTLARPDTIEDPEGIDCARFSCPYFKNGVFPYQGPMGYQGHCESTISTAANWDLARSLVQATDEDTGWQRFTDIWMTSILPAQAAFRVANGGSCNPLAEVDGCGASNWYTVFIAADDDDGNLANSTPNACRIYAAFDAHGIACGEPMPCTDGCSPVPFPDAGPSQQICLGESVEIGTEALPEHSYLWTPGEGTTALLTVAPTTTTTYEVAATTACGTFTDSTTVFVDDGLGIGLNEEFELGTEGWQLDGLWHVVSDTTCVDPGATSGLNALYFARQVTCDYDAGGRVDGDAISPQVDGLDASSVLRFDYFMEVEESAEASYDRFTVSVQEVGENGWQTLWARDSQTPGTGVWQTTEGLSLAPWAGKSVRLRFRFDSVDASFNRFRGVLIDNVAVTAVAVCDYPPRVTVASPVDGAVIANGTAVEFSARAFDREDGLLTDGLEWTSDLDGDLGSGGELTVVLSLGSHTITTSVLDSNGGIGRAELRVDVVDAAPSVTITSPADGALLQAGVAADLEATAIDAEDGDLSADIEWSSDQDGDLGSGPQIQVLLSEGTHQITATAVDSMLQTGQASHSVSVEPPPNEGPALAILSPTGGDVVMAGQAVIFTGSASDPEDGDLSASLSWTSDIDGALGSGASLSAALSVGVHVITATVIDSAGAEAEADIEVIATPDGSPPLVLSAESLAAEDGYIRESAAGSGVGDFANATGTGTRALRLGDASGDRQYRTVLSFETSALPEGAQILDVRLEMRRGRLIGVDPFADVFGACWLDVTTGSFGPSSALESEDFAAAPTMSSIAKLFAAAADGELARARFDASARDAVNRVGRTQIRLAFELASDGDGGNDYVGFWSGEADADDRPRLIITYLEGR